MVRLSQSTPLVRLDQSQHWLLSRQPISRLKTAPALAIGSGGGSGGTIVYKRTALENLKTAGAQQAHN